MRSRPEDGYSMIDVLVAIVVLGVATGAIFAGISTNQAAVAGSTHRTWATLIGSRIVAEQDLGLKSERMGEVHVPWTGTTYRWETVQATADELNGPNEANTPAVGVSWDAQGVAGRVVVGGFVDRQRAR